MVRAQLGGLRRVDAHDAPHRLGRLPHRSLVLLVLGYVRRRLGRDAATEAGTLFALCAFFAYYGGSYRAHTATALLVFVAFLLWERAEREARGRAALIAASFCWGWSGQYGSPTRA